MNNADSSGYRWIQTESIGDAVIIGFTQRKIVDARSIQELGEELYSLAATARHIVLNFSSVDIFFSAALQKLIAFDQRVRKHLGRVVLCALKPEIQEVFQVIRLSQYFLIVASVTEALAIFNGRQLGVICPFLNCGHEEKVPLIRLVDQGYRLQCSSCLSQYWLNMDQGTHAELASVITWTVPTYEGRFLTLRLSANGEFPHTIEMAGECDLYVADALDRLIHSLSGPRHVVVDVSQIEGFTGRAAQKLNEIVAFCRQEGTFAIRNQMCKEPLPFDLPASLQSPADNAAVFNDASPPIEARPVRIRIRYFEERREDDQGS